MPIPKITMYSKGYNHNDNLKACVLRSALTVHVIGTLTTMSLAQVEALLDGTCLCKHYKGKPQGNVQQESFYNNLIIHLTTKKIQCPLTKTKSP